MRFRHLLLLLALLPAGAQAAPKQVLMLHSFGRDFAPFTTVSATLRTELARSLRDPVVFYEASPGDEMADRAAGDRALVGFLRNRYAAAAPDLVIAMGGPAIRFYLANRARLFPGVPLLAAGADERVIAAVKLAPGDRSVAMRLDLPAIGENIVRVLPDTTALAVIIGSSPFERFWLSESRRDLATLSLRVKLVWLTDLSLDEVRERVAALPPRSAVWYGIFTVGKNGVPYANEQALAAVTAASSAPVFGTFDNQLGEGIVGGPLVGLRKLGSLAASTARGMLEGPGEAEQPGPVLADWMAFDARALARWGIPESRLPAGAEVLFRPPTLWQQYKALIVAVGTLLVLQAGLIAALLIQRTHRQRAENEAQRQRAELAQASRLALAGELSASIAHEINQPLGAILANASAAEVLLRRHPEVSEELRAILADIRSADLRASEIVKRVRSLVTARHAEREAVDLNGMVRETLAFLRGEAARRGVAVEAVLEPGLPALLADRVQMQQALVNLCVNAMEAMAATAGERRLGVRTRVTETGIEIAVSDSGPGIPAENLGKVFDSFFTTKTGGTGLGLAITRSIVDAHGGTIAAENLKRGGACLRMVLPAEAPA